MKKLMLLGYLIACNGGQKPDLEFDTSVASPVYSTQHPRVLYDEAHRNFHKADGTYKPFANLVRNDGYLVEVNDKPFTTDLLKPYDVLIICCPKGEKEKDDPAFDIPECDAVESWVRGGGALLFIAEHHPIGGAARVLAERFGVDVTNGSVSDSLHYQGSPKWQDELVFTRDRYLGVHAILEGRSEKERINKIVTFTGTSLKGPDSAIVLLRLSDAATETIKDSAWTENGNHYTRFSDPVSASGRNQGLAMAFGKGRLIMLGEAGMCSAQYDDDGTKFGMNVPGLDNKQFVLNMMHWLTHIL